MRSLVITAFQCVVVFLGSSLVGFIWFLFCRWNELLVCRNYKPLAVVIPLTFAIALVLTYKGLSETPGQSPITPDYDIILKKESPPAKKLKKEKKKRKADAEVYHGPLSGPAVITPHPPDESNYPESWKEEHPYGQ